MNLRIFVSCLLLAAICLPFLIVPDVHSQTATTTSMTIPLPPQGQCSVLPLAFSGRTGQEIGGVFGADVAINLYIVSESDYIAFNKTGGCALPASARPLFEETNVVGTHNNYGTTPFPTDGTYYFIFIYRNTGFAQLTSKYVTITMSFPSSLALVSASSNTVVTTTVSSTVQSPLTSTAVSSTTQSALTTLSSLISTTSSISSPSSSAALVTISVASPIASSTEAQPASGAVPLTTLFLVIASAIIACGGLIGGIMFRNRKRHALSNYLTNIDSTYNRYAVDREECRSQLERLKRDAIEMLKNGKIDEGHFLMLDEKISQYLKDLARTAKQRTSVDQTESGEADQATFCKNCGTRLTSEEKLCRKCGTKRQDQE